MKAEKRRKDIIGYLLSVDKPVSGTTLSEKFGVSRQIIVQDITVLKAEGYDILSTHYGYVLHGTPHKERVIKVYHTTNETEDELNTIVDLGGIVADVFVWHKVYGKMSAKLNIFSTLQIKQFITIIIRFRQTQKKFWMRLKKHSGRKTILCLKYNKTAKKNIFVKKKYLTEIFFCCILA